MLRVELANSVELAEKFKRAQALMDELSSIFYSMNIKLEIAEKEPSAATDSSETD